MVATALRRGPTRSMRPPSATSRRPRSSSEERCSWAAPFYGSPIVRRLRRAKACASYPARARTAGSSCSRVGSDGSHVKTRSSFPSALVVATALVLAGCDALVGVDVDSLPFPDANGGSDGSTRDGGSSDATAEAGDTGDDALDDAAGDA